MRLTVALGALALASGLVALPAGGSLRQVASPVLRITVCTSCAADRARSEPLPLSQSTARWRLPQRLLAALPGRNDALDKRVLSVMLPSIANLIGGRLSALTPPPVHSKPTDVCNGLKCSRSTPSSSHPPSPCTGLKCSCAHLLHPIRPSPTHPTCPSCRSHPARGRRGHLLDLSLIHISEPRDKRQSRMPSSA